MRVGCPWLGMSLSFTLLDLRMLAVFIVILISYYDFHFYDLFGVGIQYIEYPWAKRCEIWMHLFWPSIHYQHILEVSLSLPLSHSLSLRHKHNPSTFCAIFMFHDLVVISSVIVAGKGHGSSGRKAYGGVDSLPKIPLPVFGLASYKLKGSILTPSGNHESQQASSLLQYAGNWLKRLQVDLPDYQFFLSHNSQWRWWWRRNNLTLPNSLLIRLETSRCQFWNESVDKPEVPLVTSHPPFSYQNSLVWFCLLCAFLRKRILYEGKQEKHQSWQGRWVTEFDQ